MVRTTPKPERPSECNLHRYATVVHSNHEKLGQIVANKKAVVVSLTRAAEALRSMSARSVKPR